MFALTRRLLALAALALLAGCAGGSDRAGKDGPSGQGPIGEFKLGHNIVVAKNVQKVQPSRDVTPEEWEAALEAAIDRRFSSYTGSQFYHIAVNVLGYSVAVPGIPVVLAPKSLVVVEASIWDDAKQAKINAEPRKFWVYESLSPDLVVGSGLTRSESEQVADLSANIAGQIEKWMRENPEWFARR